MRNTILILFCIYPGLITLILIMAIYGRVNRSMELKSNLSSVMEETVVNAMNSENYKIRNEKEFVADYVEMLVDRIDARSEIRVDISQCDREKGILSSCGTFFYKHPNGKIGSVKEGKTVIYSQTREVIPLERCRVEFYVGEKCYKFLEVCKNSVVLPPKQPEIADKRFMGWINTDGTEVDFSKPIMNDIIYYADIQ